MARTAQATVRRFIVFVKVRRDNVDYLDRRPYDVVEYNWGEGPLETYLQPHFGSTRSPSETEELYHDIRVYSEYPTWDLMPRT